METVQTSNTSNNSAIKVFAISAGVILAIGILLFLCCGFFTMISSRSTTGSSTSSTSNISYGVVTSSYSTTPTVTTSEMTTSSVATTSVGIDMTEFRTAYIEACVGGKTSSVAYCTCTYEGLLKYYGDAGFLSMAMEYSRTNVMPDAAVNISKNCAK